MVLFGMFSLLSWAIIIYKGIALHRAHSQSETFLQVFRKSNKFSEVNSVCVRASRRARSSACSRRATWS